MVGVTTRVATPAWLEKPNEQAKIGLSESFYGRSLKHVIIGWAVSFEERESISILPFPVFKIKINSCLGSFPAEAHVRRRDISPGAKLFPFSLSQFSLLSVGIPSPTSTNDDRLALGYD